VVEFLFSENHRYTFSVLHANNWRGSMNDTQTTVWHSLMCEFRLNLENKIGEGQNGNNKLEMRCYGNQP